MKGWRLTASWRWWAATVLGCLIFAGLGLWQIRRGGAERRAIAQLRLERRAPPVGLSRGAELPPHRRFVHARADGIYDAARQVLVDGQAHGGVPGYDVLTPLRLTDGAVLLVNRGFVPSAGRSRARASAPPAPGGRRVVVGLWRALPQPALRLSQPRGCRPFPAAGASSERRPAAASAADAGAGFPARVLSYPTAAKLRCLYGAGLVSGELLLDAGQPDGFVRDWRISPGFPPSRHYGYAAQWFLFLVILVVLFVKLNLRRVPR